MSRRLIGYPAGWTLAVMDGTDAARAAAEELRGTGVGEDDVIVLEGAESTERMKRLGTSDGVAARIRRTMQFLTMDQLPDLHVYETALEQGYPVIGIRVPESEARTRAIGILRRRGAHFINRFGAWATEEIAPWRGRMPDLPQHMLR